MTPEDREALAEGLRALADEVTRPTFPTHDVRITIESNVWGHITEDGKESTEYGAPYQILPEASRKNLRKLVGGLGGKREKHYGDGGFTCRREFGPHVSVTITASRETVCRKVPTGNKIIRAAVTLPETVEDEFEWECEPVMLGAAYHDGGAA